MSIKIATESKGIKHSTNELTILDWYLRAEYLTGTKYCPHKSNLQSDV